MRMNKYIGFDEDSSPEIDPNQPFTIYPKDIHEIPRRIKRLLEESNNENSDEIVKK